MNKPQPTHELIVEPSEQCERCLMLYAVSEPARAFIKAECAQFGILKPVDFSESEAPRLMRIIIGQPAPSAPASEPVVFTLHVWPNYDIVQVRTWLEKWPHISEPFAQAIEAMR